MQKVAFGYLGLKPKEFWSLTYGEWELMIEGYLENREKNVELINSFVTKLAFKIGLANRLKRLNYKKLEDKKTKNNVKLVNKDEHKKLINYIENKIDCNKK